ncbi:MAG: chloramphenicol phosphotransferase [Pseudomonadota bacterium]
MARIIFLHGPSSAGKTTLAHALRPVLASPHLHLSIDHLRDSGAWDPSFYSDWGTARSTFFDGFHRAVAGFADAGNDLILEHILDTDGWHENLQRLLAAHHVLFVGLHTPLDSLNAREAARQDRPTGSAAHDFARVHDGCQYDLTLQGNDPAEKNAVRIVKALAEEPGRSRFFLPRNIARPGAR